MRLLILGATGCGSFVARQGAGHEERPGRPRSRSAQHSRSHATDECAGYRISEHHPPPSGLISRADGAHAVLDMVEKGEHVRKVIGVAR
jgi:hypothetical protein